MAQRMPIQDRGKVGFNPLILFVPHAKMTLDKYARERILLDDDDLYEEAKRVLDLHLDVMFDLDGVEVCAGNTSRLAVDLDRERADGFDAMSRVGMGAVHTHTTDGRTMRHLTPDHREELLRNHYDPMVGLMDSLVRLRLESFGRCLILEGSSYPSAPFFYEDPSVPRPEVCIATDPYHTPAPLARAVLSFFGRKGYTVGLDTPSAGTFVPPAFRGRDPRVQSVRIDLRRDVYMDEETGEKTARYAQVEADVAELILELRGPLAIDVWPPPNPGTGRGPTGGMRH